MALRHNPSLGNAWYQADETEAAFYEAMAQGDLDGFMSCWAEDPDVVCVLPGGTRLVGSGAIREVVEQLFANGTVRITPQQVLRVSQGDGAMHSVLERIEVQTQDGPREAYVLATNVYHRDAQGWRLVAHHASPATPEAAEQPAAGQVLH